jgi:hypothetical protein
MIGLRQMDLDLSPSWPPPRRWYAALVIGAVIAGLIPVIGIIASGVQGVDPLLAGAVIALVLAGFQAAARKLSSRSPRILRLKDEDLTALVKLIDQAAQSRDRGLLSQARDYLILHKRISRRDAAAAVAKLVRRDYPELADRLGYLD